ncbi:dihydrolipoamide acetyltransferase family protein [Bradyrhizobium yuanmingense]|nr:dihydrolipoamide acetyltransferase family protein [Bradyrhizobium yuanmingense]
MPKLGLTMIEGIVAKWSVAPGAQFERDQNLFVVETEKAANDVLAEQAGTLLEIVHPAGTTVPVGEVIGWWEDGTLGEQGNAQVQQIPAQMVQIPTASRDPATTPASSYVSQRNNVQRVIATPLARREAKSRGVSLTPLRGSGPRGRIKVADVFAAANTQVQQSASASATPRRLNPSKVAAIAARRLVKAKQEIPHFYLAVEAGVARLLDLRRELMEASGVRYTINDFILSAVGRALVDVPEANRVWAEGALLEFDHSDVGMAVNTEHGLFVPVLRDVGSSDLGRVSQEAARLADLARQSALGAAEMEGGAITVSNAGMHNVTYMTPIVNPGQSMILGVGSVRELFRPDDTGRPEMRREMGMVLACDHRVLDGVSGLRFLHQVVHFLEKPSTLLVSHRPV